MKSTPTQADMESDWCIGWMAEIRTANRYHRKSWECAWMLESMRCRELLSAGLSGLGFGVGLDSVAPVLVKMGHSILLTDVEPKTEQLQNDWVKTGQHCGGDLSLINHKGIVPSAEFERLARFQYLDMNGEFGLGPTFDYCWSLNSLDHLGSIDLAKRFLVRSMEVLKPGGWAFHTTELNITPPDGPPDTYTHGSTVFMRPVHLSEAVSALIDAGHHVDPLDLTPGDGPIDQYVDRPPFQPDNNNTLNRHLKMENNGWVITSVGITIRKKQ